MPTQETIESAKRFPMYWFAVLDRAISEGDFEAAADAVRQLRELGIEVRYRATARLREVAR